MRQLGNLTPISGNAVNYGKQREAQFRHFAAAYRRAVKNFPQGFAIDTLGNIVNRDSGFVVAVDSYDSLEALLDNGFNYKLVSDGERSVYAFGYWQDNGKQYFERVKILADLGQALDLARLRGEKAIYSFAAGECIAV